MTEPESRGEEPNEQNVRDLLQWLGPEEVRCMLCDRILFESRLHGGLLRTLEIRGVELSRKEQIAHLSHCVPDRQRRGQ